jgi:ribosome biogenesis GTPase
MSYPTVLVSARTRTGLDQLDALFQDHTSVFVGLSGVGKSSLIAHWCPEETIPVANVNPNTGQGRHTTTVARLYHLPRGGDLIDSPGVRTFGLYQMDPQEVPYHFRDLAPHVGHCRFANCRHEQEPGCALVQAVATGAAYPERLESLRNLMRSSRRAYEGRYDATVTGG